MSWNPEAIKHGCPGSWETCVLFALSHDGRLCRLGCVDDLARPCKVARGASYERMRLRAVRETFRLVRARLWPATEGA